MYWGIRDLDTLRLIVLNLRGLGVMRGNGLEDEGRPSSRKYSSDSALSVFVYTQAL
jgi:hypothetical protein